MFLFEKLMVYQRALDFAERVSALTRSFSRPDWYLADQFNRASLSICLNIAEGNGRATEADRRSFFVIARGSAHECVPLLEMCRRRRLLTDQICQEMKAEIEIIAKMLAGLISQRGPSGSVRRTHCGST